MICKASHRVKSFCRVADAMIEAIVHIRKLDSALHQHRFNGLFHSLLGVEAQVLQVDTLSLRLRQQHITPCSVQPFSRVLRR